MKIQNAVIESVEITTNDRGILDVWVHLDYGGSGQGFGGYALYLDKSYTHHRLESVAGHHIFRIMQIAGVTTWAQLKGKPIRVRTDGSFGPIEAIGHIVKEDWFCPKDDYARLSR